MSESVASSSASPHTRGWTRRQRPRVALLRGFPAHAGMDPTPACSPSACTRLPRTRGDGPTTAQGGSRGVLASPHTRGWTLGLVGPAAATSGFPAHAGMDPRQYQYVLLRPGLPRTRGDGPKALMQIDRRHQASPHTRGWTLTWSCYRGGDKGFPAHAGMDPSPAQYQQLGDRLPRTRGDGPLPHVAVVETEPASPHTRGWTRSS